MVMIIDGLSIKNLQKRTRYTRLEAPERDDLKKVLCKENGIELIEFDYTEPLIESYIRTKLEKFMSTNGIQL